MSKNFELMQEMETRRALPSQEAVEPAFPLPRENGSATGRLPPGRGWER